MLVATALHGGLVAGGDTPHPGLGGGVRVDVGGYVEVAAGVGVNGTVPR